MYEKERDDLIDQIVLSMMRERLDRLRQMEIALSNGCNAAAEFSKPEMPRLGPGGMMGIDSIVVGEYADALEQRIVLESQAESEDVLRATKALLQARRSRMMFGLHFEKVIELVDAVEDSFRVVLYSAATLARDTIGSGREFIREAELATKESLVDAIALLHRLEGAFEAPRTEEVGHVAPRRTAGANALAMEMLMRRPDMRHATSEQWGQALGISPSRVRNLPCWKTARAITLVPRRSHVDITVVAQDEDTLDKLIREQEAERRAQALGKVRARRL